MTLTTLLDLVGALLVIAALGVFVGAYSLPGGIAVAGAGVLALSYLLDLQAAARRRQASNPQEETT